MTLNNRITNQSIEFALHCPVLGQYFQNNLLDDCTNDYETTHLIDLAAKQLRLPINNSALTISQTTPLQTIQDCCYTQLKLTFNHLESAVHLLYVTNNKVNLVELSQSYHPSRRKLNQLAFSYFIAQQLNLHIHNFWIYTINSAFKLTNKSTELFIPQNMTRRVKRLVKHIQPAITLLAQQQNQIKPTLGKPCFKPNRCSQFKRCWPMSNQWDIFNLLHLPLDEKLDQFNTNCQTFNDIKQSNLQLNSIQKRQLNAELSQRPQLNIALLTQCLSLLTDTFQVLDIEAAQFTAPLFTDQAPFAALPFLYSIHQHDSSTSTTSHKDAYFLPTTDFRREFAQQLINDLNPEQSIVIFDSTLEKKIFSMLMQRYPDLSHPLMVRQSLFIDIAPLFNKHHIILPGMKGKSSMKNIIECIQSSVDFSNLSIQSGNDVVKIYKELIFNKQPTTTAIENNLKLYCKQDTKALLDLTLYLKTFIR